MSYGNSRHQALHSWRAGDAIAKNTLHISWSEQNGGICWRGIMAHLLNNYTGLQFGISVCVEPLQRNVIASLHFCITRTFLGEV